MKRGVGLVSILIGCVLFLDSFRLTSFVILENYKENLGGVLGIIFFIFGIGMLAMDNMEKKIKLEEKIPLTKDRHLYTEIFYKRRDAK